MPMPIRMPHEVSLDEVASRLMMNENPGCNNNFCSCLSFHTRFYFTNMISPQEWVGQQSDRSSPEEEDEEVTSDWTDPEAMSTKVAGKVASKVVGCLPDPGVSTKTHEIVDC